MGLPAPQETESTFVGNAGIKAHAAFQATGLATLADDSGFAVDALDGAPGVWTADWCRTEDGTTNFDLGMSRIHDAIRTTGVPGPWTARLICALVLILPNGSERVFEGVASSQVVWPGRGTRGRALEPIFAPDDADGLTLSEMAQEEKLVISHRAKAFGACRDFLARNPDILQPQPKLCNNAV